MPMILEIDAVLATQQVTLLFSRLCHLFKNNASPTRTLPLSSYHPITLPYSANNSAATPSSVLIFLLLGATSVSFTS